MVIYFSRAGQNKQHGAAQFINVGNTALVADKLATQLGCPAVALQAIPAYAAEDYAATLQRTKAELAQAAAVQLAPLTVDLTAQTQLLLGFPIWWRTLPQVVVTFLQQVDLAGKQLYPFCTHEGSGFGRSLDALQKLAPQAQLLPGLAVRGSNAYKADQALTNWLQSLQLK
ncbi:flavodoxin [Loigolactobacillus coryniformis]|uniref:flavodoxin n=1 Tax=Loigolactobacillus coryniformis TaxID=1610 RepID=UPI001CDAC189|nr:flavodoxin [Loigolactobacillus coryniformis]